jgi:type II secretory pathway component PulK
MTQQRDHRNLRQGAALMMAIFVMAVASALVVSMLNTQMLRYSALRNTRDWDHARYLAEAGLHHAFSHLENDIDWRTEVPTTEFPIGSGHTYSASIRNGLNGTVIIDARGTAGPFSRVLTATVKHGG